MADAALSDAREQNEEMKEVCNTAGIWECSYCAILSHQDALQASARYLAGHQAAPASVGRTAVLSRAMLAMHHPSS